jgi:hypothetical protein
LVIDINTLGTSATLTVKIQVYDGTNWVDLPEAVTTALASVAVTTLTVAPGVEEDANVAIAMQLPQRWRVVATAAVETVNFNISAYYLP